MIRVRAARPEDIEALAEIGLAAWKEAIKPLVAADVAKRIESNNPFLPFLRDQDARVLVAELDGALVGLGASEHGDNNISDIWISPLHEGKGRLRPDRRPGAGHQGQGLRPCNHPGCRRQRTRPSPLPAPGLRGTMAARGA